MNNELRNNLVDELQANEEISKEVKYCMDLYMKSLSEDGFYHYMGDWYDSKTEMLKAYNKCKNEFDKVIIRECKVISIE